MNKKNKLISILLFIIIISTLIIDVYAIKTLRDDQSIVHKETLATDTKIEPTCDYTEKRCIAELVNVYADYYGVSRRAMHLIVANESTYNINARGDGGHSYGVVQINMRFWGSKISIEEAKNPHFALDFLARKIKEGDGSLWTTYRTCVQGQKIYHNGKQITCDTSKVIII